jgi:murein DD-endopeptidase MepM/ murein hydrolase activator NlpD
MPRTKAIFFVAALAAWLALALPVGADTYPETPAGARPEAPPAGSLPASIRALAPKKDTVSGNTAAASPPGALTALSRAALPRKAIGGWVQSETSLPYPRLSLGRPFADGYRQSPEFTFPYGSRGEGRYVLHTGVDIVNPLGTPVRAVADGQVAYAGNDALQVFGPRPGYYGNLIVTRLDGTPEAEPVFVLFGHLDKILVVPGQQVQAGDVLGLVGMTGIAIGPHLHLEVRQGQNSYQATRNPALWLSSLPGQGTLAGRIVDEVGRPVAGERLLVYRAERPNQVWRVLRSYLDSPLIHGDDAAAENFALLDVPAGDYRIVAGRAGALIQTPVRIEPGRLTLVEFRVEGGR